MSSLWAALKSWRQETGDRRREPPTGHGGVGTKTVDHEAWLPCRGEGRPDMVELLM